MLRPATPLSVLLFIAFALELLSVLSTPVIKAIPLATYGGVTYGVFGFCQDNGNSCTFKVGYAPPSRESCLLSTITWGRFRE